MSEEVSSAKSPEKVEKIKGHCPNCGPNKNAAVVGHHQIRDDDDESGVWALTDYRILKCGGCNSCYFQSVSIFSEDYDQGYHPITGETTMTYNENVKTWPAPSRRERPDWLSDIQPSDKTLHKILDETYSSLDNDAHILAAIGIRTAFDRTSELLDIDPAKGFEEKLKNLFQNGNIGLSEKAHLSVLTDAGGAAAHRGWAPTLKELSTLMAVLEGFIHHNLIIPNEVSKLSSIPKKPPRKKLVSTTTLSKPQQK